MLFHPFHSSAAACCSRRASSRTGTRTSFRSTCGTTWARPAGAQCAATPFLRRCLLAPTLSKRDRWVGDRAATGLRSTLSQPIPHYASGRCCLLCVLCLESPRSPPARLPRSSFSPRAGRACRCSCVLAASAVRRSGQRASLAAQRHRRNAQQMQAREQEGIAPCRSVAPGRGARRARDEWAQPQQGLLVNVEAGLLSRASLCDAQTARAAPRGPIKLKKTCIYVAFCFLSFDEEVSATHSKGRWLKNKGYSH